MKEPNKEQIDEMRESLEDVFESIATHEGQQVSDFVHGLVSMKQIADGMRIVCSLTSELAHKANDERAQHMAEFIASNATRLFSMAIAKFHAASGESFEIKKCIEWAQKIDEQMERCAERVSKN